MNNQSKYIIIGLLALTKTLCWGAASPDEQLARNLAESTQQVPIEQTTERDIEQTTGPNNVEQANQWASADSNLEELPDEVLEYLASSLDPRSLLKMAQASKRFQTVINNIRWYKFLRNSLRRNKGSLEAVLFEAIKPFNRSIHGTEIIKYLARYVDLDAENNKGYTPLMQAAENGDQETVQILINHGADINSTDENSC